MRSAYLEVFDDLVKVAPRKVSPCAPRIRGLCYLKFFRTTERWAALRLWGKHMSSALLSALSILWRGDIEGLCVYDTGVKNWKGCMKLHAKFTRKAAWDHKRLRVVLRNFTTKAGEKAAMVGSKAPQKSKRPEKPKPKPLNDPSKLTSSLKETRERRVTFVLEESVKERLDAKEEWLGKLGELRLNTITAEVSAYNGPT